MVLHLGASRGLTWGGELIKQKGSWRGDRLTASLGHSLRASGCELGLSSHCQSGLCCLFMVGRKTELHEPSHEDLVGCLEDGEKVF